MALTSDAHPTTLRSALDEIIETNGRWRVVLALLLRSLRPAPLVPPLGLNDHLRRDIGLERLPPPRDCLL